VIEKITAPIKRTIKVCRDLDEITRYHLCFPKAIFKIVARSCENVGILGTISDEYFMTELSVSFFDRDDKEVLLPLPNIIVSDDNNVVCLGPISLRSNTLDELISKIIEEFWNSTFTTLITRHHVNHLWHLCCLYEAKLNKPYPDILNDWQENPDFKFIGKAEAIGIA